MPQQTGIDATEDWCADDMESDCMSDDDFELDELDDDEVDELPEEKVVTNAGGSVPVWRLIEMSRENRYLQAELADFEDYDGFDGLGDDGSETYMH